MISYLSVFYLLNQEDVVFDLKLISNKRLYGSLKIYLFDLAFVYKSDKFLIFFHNKYFMLFKSVKKKNTPYKIEKISTKYPQNIKE